MKMRRSIVMNLVCLGLGTLSCQFATSPTANRAELAAHPQTPTHHSAPRAQYPLPVDPRQIAIANELRARHTVLSDAEIVALAHTIVRESVRHNLDPDLVLAVIEVESGGHHLAVSPVGAMGLMQLLPSTAQEVAGKHGVDWRGPASLFDPFLNVKLGTAYLRELTDRFGDVNTALAAYNWGPGHINRRLRKGNGLPSRYVRLVKKAYDARETSTPARRS